jgi:hypothetical protein
LQILRKRKQIFAPEFIFARARIFSAACVQHHLKTGLREKLQPVLDVDQDSTTIPMSSCTGDLAALE